MSSNNLYQINNSFDIVATGLEGRFVDLGTTAVGLPILLNVPEECFAGNTRELHSLLMRLSTLLASEDFVTANIFDANSLVINTDDRIVLNKYWHYVLETNGINPSNLTFHVAPSIVDIPFSKFYKYVIEDLEEDIVPIILSMEQANHLIQTNFESSVFQVLYFEKIYTNYCRYMRFKGYELFQHYTPEILRNAEYVVENVAALIYDCFNGITTTQNLKKIDELPSYPHKKMTIELSLSQLIMQYLLEKSTEYRYDVFKKILVSNPESVIDILAAG